MIKSKLYQIEILTIFVLLTSAQLFADDDENPYCSTNEVGVSTGSSEITKLQTVMTTAQVYFRSSPKKFTRNGPTIKEGAIYSKEGKILCILKDDPAAYIYNPNFEIEQMIENDKKTSPYSTLSNETCEMIALRSFKISLPNSDLLNRLNWSIAEGNCNPIVSDSEFKTPIYYQGFALHNLRKNYKSENDMLKGSANGGHNDFYKSYFIDGSGNAKESFTLIHDPFSWEDSARKEAFEGNKLSKRMSHCFMDLLESFKPNAVDPIPGKIRWGHNAGGCLPKQFTVKFKIYSGTNWAKDTYCCFKEKLNTSTK